VGILREGELVALGKPSELKSLVDKKLRLELFFAPDAPPCLPPAWPRHELDAAAGWFCWNGNRPPLSFNSLDMSKLDDFRLYSATLEDLYLHYANKPQTAFPVRPTD